MEKCKNDIHEWGSHDCWMGSLWRKCRKCLLVQKGDTEVVWRNNAEQTESMREKDNKKASIGAWVRR